MAVPTAIHCALGANRRRTLVKWPGFVNNPAVSYSATRKQVPMGIAYLVITILLAAMVTFSGIGKIRRDPRIVQVIHEVVGVPLKYFPLLAACEFAGALGTVLGILWPPLGMAGIGLVLYFLGAVISHLRVGDVKGVGPAAFMLVVAAATLTLRVLTSRAASAG